MYQEFVECAVHKGAVLGPVWFNFYVNDLFELKTSGRKMNFADDSVLFRNSRTCKVLKQTIENDFDTFLKYFDSIVLTTNSNISFFSLFVLQLHYEFIPKSFVRDTIILG